MSDPVKRKEWAQRRKVAGLCVRCPAPTENGKTYCKGCAENIRNSQKKLRRERRAAGLCRCGRPSEGAAYCKDCKEKRKIEAHETYYMRVKNGLCGLCGKPAVEGLVSCERHR